MKWLLSAIGAALLLVLGGASAYALSYADKGLPGTTIAGRSIAGMSREEAVETVKGLAEGTRVSFDVDSVETETGLADAGISVDAEATVDRAFEPNASILSRFTSLVSPHEVAPVLDMDEAALDAFARRVADSTGDPAKEAEVLLGEDGATFTSTPAKAGKQIDVEAVKDAVKTQAGLLAPASVSLDAVEVEPVITTEAAKAVADAANALVALDVVLSDGIEEFTAAPADKASWVIIGSKEDGTLAEPAWDQAKISEWVNATAQASNVEAVKGVNNVNSAGEVLTVAKKGVSGWTVNNADKVTAELMAALDSKQSYSGEFDYDEVTPQYDTRQIAEGAENLVYQAAPGEKWIDVNLSESSVIAYEGAKVVGGPYYMVPGAPDTPTVTGTYHVYLKYAQQTMRGENTDGSKYVTPDVPWVTYWTGSYAFHGAPWRSSFGWSGPGGSHGCVNMPVSAAKFIYDWSEMGTTVVSHY